MIKTIKTRESYLKMNNIQLRSFTKSHTRSLVCWRYINIIEFETDKCSGGKRYLVDRGVTKGEGGPGGPETP